MKRKPVSGFPFPIRMHFQRGAARFPQGTRLAALQRSASTRKRGGAAGAGLLPSTAVEELARAEGARFKTRDAEEEIARLRGRAEEAEEPGDVGRKDW